MIDDNILPDEKDLTKSNVFARINKEINETGEEFKTDELFYWMTDYRGWVKALKPYIESRIEVFRQMEEDFLQWGDSMDEIGIRYMLCRFVAKELQGIIDHVETTSGQIKKMKEEKKGKNDNKK